ncbi:MAG TPA: glutathione S-transferase family protein [Thermohalobaculum sp.]|nr:glutathione S-transferase family protein [Thermohalobaculum sp.]
MPKLTLISHHLCPYVQRAAIALAEKDVPFERIYIDLANKPDWFRAISPLGKVPVLKIEHDDGTSAMIFESAVILEYLEETLPNPLHPTNPLEWARHRGWIEYGSATLNRISRFYSAADPAALKAEARELAAMFARIEDELVGGPWFAGEAFSLVDAVYGPIFRYFDVIDRIGDFGILTGKPELAAWRMALAARPSVRDAVSPDYPERLRAFFERKGSALTALIREAALEPDRKVVEPYRHIMIHRLCSEDGGPDALERYRSG